MNDEDGKTGTLRFVLPGHAVDLDIAIHSGKLFWELWEFVNNELRGKLKYGHDFKSANEAFEWCRQELVDLIEESGLGHLDTT